MKKVLEPLETAARLNSAVDYIKYIRLQYADDDEESTAKKEALMVARLMEINANCAKAVMATLKAHFVDHDQELFETLLVDTARTYGKFVGMHIQLEIHG